MKISERQFQYLNTMGVSLWQSRPEFFHHENKAPAEDDSVTLAPTVDTNNLTPKDSAKSKKERENAHDFDNIEQFFTHPLSADILMALNCDKSDVSLTTEGIQLDTLLWHFNSCDKCSYQEQILNTPNLAKLTKSVQLKSALWACLCKHINNHKN